MPFYNKEAVDIVEGFLTSTDMLAAFKDYFADWLSEQVFGAHPILDAFPASKWTEPPRRADESISYDKNMPLREFLLCYGMGTDAARKGNASTDESFAALWDKEQNRVVDLALEKAAHIILDKAKVQEDVRRYILRTGLSAARNRAAAKVTEQLADVCGTLSVGDFMDSAVSEDAVTRRNNRRTIAEQMAKYIAQLRDEAKAVEEVGVFQAFLDALAKKGSVEGELDDFEATDLRDLALTVFFNIVTYHDSLLSQKAELTKPVSRLLYARQMELENAYPYADFEFRMPASALKAYTAKLDKDTAARLTRESESAKPNALLAEVRAGLLSESIYNRMMQAPIDCIYLDDRLGGYVLKKNKDGKLEPDKDMPRISGNMPFVQYLQLYSDKTEPFILDVTDTEPFTCQRQLDEDIKTAVWEAIMLLTENYVENQADKPLSEDEAMNKTMDMLSGENTLLITPLFNTVSAKVSKELHTKLRYMTLAQVYDLATPRAREKKLEEMEARLAADK